MDHTSHLSSAKESVIQLSPLLCQIDPFLEVGVLDDPFQGSNLRIQHLKNSGIDALTLTATT